MNGNNVDYYEFSKEVLPSPSAAEASWSRASGDPYDAEGAWGAVPDTTQRPSGYYGQNPVGNAGRRNSALDDLMIQRQMDGAPSQYNRAPMTRQEVVPYTSQGWGANPLQSQGYDTIENRRRYGAYDGSNATFPGYQHYREETQGFDHRAKPSSYPVNTNMHWLEQTKARTARDYVDNKKRLSPICRHELSTTHAATKSIAYAAFVAASMIYMNASRKETAAVTALALGLGAALAWTPSYEK